MLFIELKWIATRPVLKEILEISRQLGKNFDVCCLIVLREGMLLRVNGVPITDKRQIV